MRKEGEENSILGSYWKQDPRTRYDESHLGGKAFPADLSAYFQRSEAERQKAATIEKKKNRGWHRGTNAVYWISATAAGERRVSVTINPFDAEKETGTRSFLLFFTPEKYPRGAF